MKKIISLFFAFFVILFFTIFTVYSVCNVEKYKVYKVTFTPKFKTVSADYTTMQLTLNNNEFIEKYDLNLVEIGNMKNDQELTEYINHENKSAKKYYEYFYDKYLSSKNELNNSINNSLNVNIQNLAKYNAIKNKLCKIEYIIALPHDCLPNKIKYDSKFIINNISTEDNEFNSDMYNDDNIVITKTYDGDDILINLD